MMKVRSDGRPDDEISAIVIALSRLYNEQGLAAFKEALPEGMWPAVNRMMDFRKVGPVLGAEIVLRLGQFCEGAL